MLYSMKNNQQNHIGTFLYLIQAKAVLFAITSNTSYYHILGSTPFEITPGSYGQQLAKMQLYVVHEYTLVSMGIQLEIVLQQTSR